MNDPVNHPAHYEQGPFECINLTESYNFCLGNAIKYVWRHPFKGNPVEDLKKAKWYVEREWERVGVFTFWVPLWMSREYRMLRTLERCDWVGARRFWKAMRWGDFMNVIDALDELIDLAQYGPWSER